VTATGPQTRAATASPPERLQDNRDFRTFWIGETVSLLGTQVTNLAVPLTAITAFHATDEEVGILRFLQLAPYIGLALLFGVWVDRHRRRPVVLWTNLVRMALIALVPLLSWLHDLNMPLLARGPRPVVVALMVASFFITYLGLGVANVIIVTVRQTAIPQQMMSRMTACFRMLLFGGGAVGGLAAGLLTAWIGDKDALTAAASFSAAVLIALIFSPVSRLRDLPPPAAHPAQRQSRG
jgi:MFS family permease